MRPQDRKTLWTVAPALLLLAACGEQRPGVADDSGSVELRPPAVSPNVHSDVSPPLGLMQSVPGQDEQREHPVKPVPRRFNPGANDPVRQSNITPMLIPAPSTNFDGVGQGFTGPAGTFTVTSAPPDTNGDVARTTTCRSSTPTSRSSARPARRSSVRCRSGRCGAASAAAARTTAMATRWCSTIPWPTAG